MESRDDEGGALRKLGHETPDRPEGAREHEAEPVDDEPVEKPLQKLIQKIVGGRGEGDDREKLTPSRDPNPPKDTKHQT